jgi:elongation factor Ts
MAIITAQMVKELREKTGAGMMDCKTALTETNGDMEAAIDWLRAKGLSKAAKKAGRVAVEGLVGVAGSGNRAAMIELNSETDFVARNEQFQSLVKAVTEAALKTDGDVESVLRAPMSGGGTVESAITNAVSTIGENMTLRRSAVLSVDQGVVASYVHAAMSPGLGKIGVLVALTSSGDQSKLSALGRQVAMHIAAASPLAVDEKRIDPQTIARERAIFAEQAKESGKPEAIIEKMVEGRLRKFYEESTLLKQAFVIDTERTVETVLKDAAKDLGGAVSVTDFVVFRLGEGAQREEQEAA